MHSFMIVLAVYAIPATALLAFAYAMEKWIEKELKKPTHR